MWQLLQLDHSDDYVCSPGISHSVRKLCDYTFSQLGMNYLDYVEQDQKFMRPLELNHLKGSTCKLNEVIDVQFEYTFESMLDEMIEYWSDKL